MRTDKKKLLKIFFDRFTKLLQQEDWGTDSEIRLRQTWLDYVKNLGCDIVMTPNGLLPFRNPNFVHIQDPATIGELYKIGPNSYSNHYHIQIPKHLALNILSIGLP